MNYSVQHHNNLLYSLSSEFASNDAFEVWVEHETDDEYVKDYHISGVRQLNWFTILNPIIDVDLDLEMELDELIEHWDIFELDISYTRYDCTLKSIDLKQKWIDKINQVIEKYRK